MILAVYIVNLLRDLKILDLVNPGLDFAQSSNQCVTLHFPPKLFLAFRGAVRCCISEDGSFHNHAVRT
jgi:hypothetical protein